MQLPKNFSVCHLIGMRVKFIQHQLIENVRHNAAWVDRLPVDRNKWEVMEINE